MWKVWWVERTAIKIGAAFWKIPPERTYTTKRTIFRMLHLQMPIGSSVRRFQASETTRGCSRYEMWNLQRTIHIEGIDAMACLRQWHETQTNRVWILRWIIWIAPEMHATFENRTCQWSINVSMSNMCTIFFNEAIERSASKNVSTCGEVIPMLYVHRQMDHSAST